MKRRRRAHQPTCRHCPRVRALGRDFQAWRAAYDAHEEHESHGYASERHAYREAHVPPTFKAYLVAMAGSGWPMSGRAA